MTEPVWAIVFRAKRQCSKCSIIVKRGERYLYKSKHENGLKHYRWCEKCAEKCTMYTDHKEELT